jgi:2-succinyl-5-enolpyruvyl-6-hydroxy-3-cyclohexene-1-carboxylate synthase
VTGPDARPANAGHALALALVDELARGGVTHVFISPGSRSGPLAMAFAADARIAHHVVLDERSAAFAAVGLAKAAGRPVCVLTTSGTAAANVHPAVLEAHHSRTPLIVLTADRPPELRATGATQTVDQIKLFGDAVRWFVEVGAPEARAGAVAYWRSLAARALSAASSPGGPVHINLALREPLAPEPDDAGWDHDISGRESGAPWAETLAGAPLPHDDEIAALARELSGVERGVLVAGAGLEASPLLDLAAALAWPVLAEPASGLRCGPGAVGAYDALLRHEATAERLRPVLAVRVGALGISRALLRWLESGVEQVLVDPDGLWLDPGRTARRLVRADPSLIAARLAAAVPRRARSAWLEEWLELEGRAQEAIDAVLEDEKRLTEPAAARALADALPADATLVVAASMPVRDLDWFMRPRPRLRVIANRGANGIDGFVSTALGAALASSGPVAALCGDLSLLHDGNGLLLARAERVGAVFVVLNNNGGGVFSFLPQARWPERFEELFGTPQDVDVEALARLHGCGYARADREAALRSAIAAAIEEGGTHLVEVRTERAANVAVHERLWRAVADAARTMES